MDQKKALDLLESEKLVFWGRHSTGEYYGAVLHEAEQSVPEFRKSVKRRIGQRREQTAKKKNNLMQCGK